LFLTVIEANKNAFDTESGKIFGGKAVQLINKKPAKNVYEIFKDSDF
jgi:hypothetical protein